MTKPTDSEIWNTTPPVDDAVILFALAAMLFGLAAGVVVYVVWLI